MSNIQTVRQLREEINRLKRESDFRKTELKNSYRNFKNSLSPLNIILSIVSEVKRANLFNSALTAFEKIRDYFRKK